MSTWKFDARTYTEVRRRHRIGPPEEIATYSTKLRTDENAPESSLTNSDLRRFTVHEPYRRTLCDSNRENCKAVDMRSQQLPFDLMEGYDSVIQKEDEDEFLSLLLECLARDDLIGQSEFVCFRNLLTKLCLTPYEVSNSWGDRGMTVAVQKVSGVFYMFEFPTEAEKKWRADLQVKDLQMSYWGTKLPSYLTVQPEENVPTPSTPLNLNREFCSVVKTTVGTHSLILRGEIDGCNANGDYVEFKTNKTLEREHHAKSLHREKLIKWWLQTSFVGAKEVCCGFRDSQGVVRKLVHYSRESLPEKMIERKPAACIAFLDDFLSFVKKNVTVDFVPHVFKRDPINSSFEMSKHEDGAFNFVPSWFAEQVIG